MTQGCFYSIYQSFSSFSFVDDDTPSLLLERSALGESSPQILHWTHELSKKSSSASKPADFGQCDSVVGVISIYSSSLLYCSAAELREGLTYWQNACKSANSTLMDLQPVIQGVTSGFIAELGRFDPSIISARQRANITSPVVLAPLYYDRASRSYVSSLRRHSHPENDLLMQFRTLNPPRSQKRYVMHGPL